MGARRVSKVALTAGALVALVALSSAATVVAQANQPRASRTDFKTADEAPADAQALNKLLAGLPQRTFLDNGTPRRYYVWEGDMLLDEQDVQAMMFAHRVRQAPARPGELLLQLRNDGQPGVWPRGRRQLTYAIDCSTFPSDNHQCDRVKTAMLMASDGWQKACATCGVKFRRVDFHPGTVPTDAPAGPTFVVRYDPQAYDYLAVSFFANDPAYKRYLDVTPGYFTTTFSRPGILRHELGHILGYRHEHNRALAGCYFEDHNWIPLTPYDPHSVMHYFCGGGGTMQLELTKSDVSGHNAAYR